VGLSLGNCPQHCKQDLLKKVGVAAHAVISKKFVYIDWITLPLQRSQNPRVFLLGIPGTRWLHFSPANLPLSMPGSSPSNTRQTNRSKSFKPLMELIRNWHIK
jgi:hypothetical protein